MIVKLTQNQVAIIDDEFSELVSKYKWQADFDKKLRKFYAKTSITVNGKRFRLRMHRLILNAQP